MHPIDKAELLENLNEIGREAEVLLADPGMRGHAPNLRRIISLLSYMREHIGMVLSMPQSFQDRSSADELQPLPRKSRLQ